MLLRKDGEALIAISQAAHAWVSGQLARHWGNDRFGDVLPEAEVCLAAEQHDIGFLAWEHAPTLDAQTGLPHSFMAMPLERHLRIWRRSVRDMTAYSRYAAWLVSLHVSGLCQRHLSHAPSSEIPVLQRFLQQQRTIQSRLKNSLRQETALSALSHDSVVRRNQRLLAAWDWMSLLLLQGFSGTLTVEDVPGVNGPETLALQAETASKHAFRVNPWPFRKSKIELVCDGKQLSSTYMHLKTMRRALRTAPTRAVPISLLSDSQENQAGQLS